MVEEEAHETKDGALDPGNALVDSYTVDSKLHLVPIIDEDSMMLASHRWTKSNEDRLTLVTMGQKKGKKKCHIPLTMQTHSYSTEEVPTHHIQSWRANLEYSWAK